MSLCNNMSSSVFRHSQGERKGSPILLMEEIELPKQPKSAALSNKEIGKRIRSIRRKRGITQQELADTLATNQGTISNIERGVRGVTVQQLVKLARVLKVSADEILGDKKSYRDKELDLFRDRQFLRRFEHIARLPKRDRQALLRTIDAALRGSQAG